ncbi:MAG: 5-methylcytosine restriction system specificity protein McrC [Acidimicrobiales bacterium]
MRVQGFLLDLYQVFENFVTVTVSQALERIDGRRQAEDPHTLDEEGEINIRPDLVWRVSGQPAAVIDAKYKAEKPSGFPEADLYQALAYATAYGLDAARLVYAAGNETARNWTARHSGTRRVAHTLDLQEPPAAILERVGALARSIAGRCPSVHRGTLL